MFSCSRREAAGALILAYFASYTTSLIFFSHPADLEVCHRVVHFAGPAPDQYRIVPYLIIRLFADVASLRLGQIGALKLAVLAFNMVFLFLALVLLKSIAENVPDNVLWGLLTGFCMAYPICMFAGPRPVTSFYVFVVALYLYFFAAAGRLSTGLVASYVVLAFSRPDLALMTCLATLPLFPSSQKAAALPLFLIIPLGAHLVTSKILFPHAQYYCPKIMLLHNLSPSMILFTPAAVLLIGIGFLFRTSLAAYFSRTWAAYPSFYWAMGLYFLATMVVGRISEWRLYLPFAPLLLFMTRRGGDR